jgi:hypothetical protein
VIWWLEPVLENQWELTKEKANDDGVSCGEICLWKSCKLKCLVKAMPTFKCSMTSF